MISMGNIAAVELDEDEYPVSGAYEAIVDWPYSDIESLFGHLMNIWPSYGRFEQRQDGTWEVATGGWSGCEELVGAMMDNLMLRACTWELSQRGGYYEFKIPEHREDNDKRD